MSEYKTEEQVKSDLGVKNWSEISTDQVKGLLQMTSSIDREVYLGILQQIPQFVEQTKAIVMAIKETIDNSVKLSMENKKYYIDLSDKILLKLDSPNLSEDNKKELIGLLPLLSKFIDDADIRDKVFMDKQMDKLVFLGEKALLLLVAIFGVKIAYGYIKDKL